MARFTIDLDEDTARLFNEMAKKKGVTKATLFRITLNFYNQMQRQAVEDNLPNNNERVLSLLGKGRKQKDIFIP